MIVTTVLIKVKRNYIQDFVDATIKNHEASIQEQGNRRFDVLRQIKDPTLFMLYEAYDTEESAKEHKETQHYKEWRRTVADYMAQPREGIKYQAVRPE